MRDLSFNPRSPRGERPSKCLKNLSGRTFQSTLPARGATEQLPTFQGFADSFNPRSPRGERLEVAQLSPEELKFQSTLPARGATPLPLLPCHSPYCVSIHAPREGSDKSQGLKPRGTRCFNPRSPRGERRKTGAQAYRRNNVSIHAPREGSDCRRQFQSR